MLRGELVTLRAVEPADYPVLAAWANDVEVELLGGGDPPTPTPQASFAELMERLRQDADSVNFVVMADGTVIGSCGLWRQDLRAGTAELGIGIGDRAYWGRGYGRDAVRVLVDYAFRLRGLRKVHLSVQATNPRAIRCYTAVGFVEEGRQRAHVWSDGRYVDLVLMGLLRGEPPASTRTSRPG